MIDYNLIKELAKEKGLTVSDLCALAPKNDPFYTGRPAEVIASEWFAGLWQQFGYTRGVHLRRMHYRIISQKIKIKRPDGNVYENTERDWDYLNEAGKWARYLGLVSPSAYVDRRNPEAIVNVHWLKPGDIFYEDPTPRYGVTDEWEDYGYDLPELPQLPGLPDDLPHPPDFQVDGYEGIQQAYHVELWCEKTTMNDVLLPLCRRYSVNLVTGAGEMSITAVVEFLQRVRQAGRPARILYISDFDPAGLGMPISVARKIEYFQRNEGHDDLDIRLHPIVLTADQVAAYQLPRVPVKDTDLRKSNFEAAYGEGQVELDALEALYPGRLAQIVTDAILQYYDAELLNEARKQRERLFSVLSSERRGVLAQYLDALKELGSDYQTLLADFAQTQERFNELVEDFQPEIDQYDSRLEAIKERARELYGQVAEELGQVEIDLDDYALPEPELPAEQDDVLYDSQRDYWDQLLAYKAQRTNTNGH